MPDVSIVTLRIVCYHGPNYVWRYHMAEQARVRISVGTGELEVAGTELFVAQYDEAVQALIGRLREQPIQPPSAGTDPGANSAAGSRGSLDIASREFGEILHALPSNASGSDQILVAGWYYQQASADNTFSTGNANQLLLGQGIKLSNPSQSLKNAIAAKRVFKVGKGYKISKTGEEHLRTLIPQL
jgi:hypothetical protein